jgi:Na+-transporting methylmalonyl-CoA/oxaloacetate decarboxylase gamma subunit
MSTLHYILIGVAVFYLLILLGIFFKVSFIVQDYPKEIEEDENKEIENKFKEHKESQL